MSDLDLLRSLGDEIVAPPFANLRENARRDSRRRAVTAVSAAAAAVVLVVAATSLAVTHDKGKPRPIGPPEVVDTTHPLTYAEGATLHYGDKAVTAPGRVVELDVTDVGVVVRTADGRISFTDGADLDQIGTLGTPGTTYAVRDFPYATTWGFVVSGNTGTRVAWLKFGRAGKPKLVVYDTEKREETFRRALPVARDTYALLGPLTERYAYWYNSPETVEDDGPVPQRRMDLESGSMERLAQQFDAADTPGAGTPRTMMVSHAQGNEPVRYRVHDATAWQFDIRGGRVVPQGAQPLDARDGATRKRFAFDAPEGYPNSGPGWLTQWLDDDTVVITAKRRNVSELLECHFSTGACEVAQPAPGGAVLPEIGPMR